MINDPVFWQKFCSRIYGKGQRYSWYSHVEKYSDFHVYVIWYHTDKPVERYELKLSFTTIHGAWIFDHSVFFTPISNEREKSVTIAVGLDLVQMQNDSIYHMNLITEEPIHKDKDLDEILMRFYLLEA